MKHCLIFNGYYFNKANNIPQQDKTAVIVYPTGKSRLTASITANKERIEPYNIPTKKEFFSLISSPKNAGITKNVKTTSTPTRETEWTIVKAKIGKYINS